MLSAFCAVPQSAVLRAARFVVLHSMPCAVLCGARCSALCERHGGRAGLVRGDAVVDAQLEVEPRRVLQHKLLRQRVRLRAVAVTIQPIQLAGRWVGWLAGSLVGWVVGGVGGRRCTGLMISIASLQRKPSMDTESSTWSSRVPQPTRLACDHSGSAKTAPQPRAQEGRKPFGVLCARHHGRGRGGASEHPGPPRPAVSAAATFLCLRASILLFIMDSRARVCTGD